jgi:hypothetical protein
MPDPSGCAEHHLIHCTACGQQAEACRLRERVAALENTVHEWEESDRARTVLGPIFTEQIEQQKQRIADLEKALLCAQHGGWVTTSINLENIRAEEREKVARQCAEYADACTAGEDAAEVIRREFNLKEQS